MVLGPSPLCRTSSSDSKQAPQVHLIVETKGFDEREEVKRAAAERWVAAVNADGTFGTWKYALAKKPVDVPQLTICEVHLCPFVSSFVLLLASQQYGLVSGLAPK